MGRPHLKSLKNIFCLKKKLNCLFFLAFLDQKYPLINPLYVINFSKKLLSNYSKKIKKTLIITKKITSMRCRIQTEIKITFLKISFFELDF